MRRILDRRPGSSMTLAAPRLRAAGSPIRLDTPVADGYNSPRFRSWASGGGRMTRYQLAKIVGWTGTVHSRKRMQKLIFLLQAAGCPLETDYDLHHYGPYSQDLARLTDEMVREKLLEERVEAHPYGERYSYALAEASRRQIDEYEAGPKGAQTAAQIAAFEPLARALDQADLRELEVAATVVFFRRRGHDWSVAVAKTCQFKDLPAGAPLVKKAEELARRIVG
jgi:uncharacterized protein YwgA